VQIYRFGEFELDLDAFELKRPEKSVKLERRALDLLALLVKQPRRLVTREEIIAALWPPNVVIDFDSGLNTLVRKVRAALGDSSDNPQYIETVPGRGYRFVASVETVARDVPVGNIGASTDTPPPSGRNQRRAIAVVIALCALAAGVATWLVAGRDTGPMRIAVLPFENLSGDDSLDYLAAGLAEETAYALTRLEGGDLQVVRASVPVASAKPHSLRELAGKLRVDLVVTSTLRVDGDRVRVTSRLLRSADEEELWSVGIDRALTNVIGVQRELSVAIAEQIRLRLSPEVAAAIEKRQTQNPEAYALFLKGRYEWQKLTPSATRRALDFYRQATRLDPDYALAWAGLAWGAISSVRSADVSPELAAPEAKYALEEALRLGPDLSEAHIALGYYRLFHEFDQPGAARAARRAVELDPDNGYAYQLLGVSLMGSEGGVEALEMMRRARELEPMLTLAFANSANVALSAGDVPGASEFSRQAIAIDADFWLGHFYLGRSLLQSGQPDAALQEFMVAARLSDGHSITYPPRLAILLDKGREDEALALVEEARERARTGFLPPYLLAQLEARMGNVDAAFTQLERAVDLRDVNLLVLRADPSLQPLRKDPRFAEILESCRCVPEAGTAR
jgi:DNA-binding winged helix-turn-helix (wHTH) protein/TolB-like protein/Flp pilus assembly protein TadD